MQQKTSANLFLCDARVLDPATGKVMMVVGIDLMAETFGLVATSETPLVICDVMRSGPST